VEESSDALDSGHRSAFMASFPKLCMIMKLVCVCAGELLSNINCEKFSRLGQFRVNFIRTLTYYSGSGDEPAVMPELV
jgi:hypothetical protein